MTDRRTRAPRRPSLRAVALASALAFVVVLALLVAQMRLGRDPVLGARATAAATPTPRRVVVRRVIVKRIVVDEIHDVDDGGATGTQVAAAAQPAPAASPPAASAPAAPAPAPAPAPLVTKSS
jgi:hypothetical protein